jgi:glutathione S-transferase
MSSNITLYSWPTPNGVKASITLEELGLSYKAEGLDISSSSNPQKEEYTSPHHAGRHVTTY